MSRDRLSQTTGLWGRCAFMFGLATLAACIDLPWNPSSGKDPIDIADTEDPAPAGPTVPADPTDPAGPTDPTDPTDAVDPPPPPSGDAPPIPDGDLPHVPAPPQPPDDPAPAEAGDGTLDYDVVYVRYPREGDTTVLYMPDGENPFLIEGGADLMLLHPNGSEEILVDCTATESVLDPVVSYDAKWVYYSKYVNLKGGKTKPRNEPADCFLFKMRVDVAAPQRREIQLTDASSPIATDKLAGNTDADLEEFNKRFGIRDMGAALLPDGRILFTSNREALIPPTQGNSSTVNAIQGAGVLQLFVMDDHDGSTPNRSLKLVGHAQLHGAFHPMILRDGRVLFSMWDDAGFRPRYGITTLYVCNPDGTYLVGFTEPHNTHKRVDHFVTQLYDGQIVVGHYYPRAMWGFGILHRYPLDPDGPDFIFDLQKDQEDYRHFSRKGIANMTPHTGPGDGTAPDLSGRYVTPAAGPGDVMWVGYSSGPVVIDAKSGPDTPVVDSGIYIVTNASTRIITDPSVLVEIKNDPNYNEIWPRPVVPYRRIYGVDKPSSNPPTGSAGPSTMRKVPLASPVGYIGTSSIQNRESKTAANDYFNANHDRKSSNIAWVLQGTDVGNVKNSDVYGVRVIAIVPDRYHRPYTSTSVEKDGLLADRRQNRHVKGYSTHTRENWKILGEFPVRGPDGQRGAGAGKLDPSGEEDTSFLARMPANTVFLYQGIDRNGMTLFTEQTWRTVAAGKTLANCGGCHAHSIAPVPFAGKKADSQAYRPWDLVSATPLVFPDASGNPKVRNDPRGVVDIEFRRDILPLLKGANRCGSCHTSSGGAPASVNGVNPVLALFDSTESGFGFDVRAYRALALDPLQEYAFGVGIPGGSQYEMPQKSRYVRAIQARRSYLVWKIYGKRLDGWGNGDFPASGNSGSADLDFTLGPCAAPSRLNSYEKSLIAKWIDLGCPIDLDDNRPQLRYTQDNAPPIVTLEAVDAGGKVTIHIGLLDIKSGIDPATFDLTIASAEGGGQASFSDLQFDAANAVGTYAPGNLGAAAFTDDTPVTVTVVVKDRAGNLQREARTFGSLK